MQPDDADFRVGKRLDRGREYVIKARLYKVRNKSWVSGLHLVATPPLLPPTYVPRKQPAGNHPLKERRPYLVVGL